MANVYTQLIWRVPSCPAAGFPGPVIPAGELWVVRDVVFSLGDLALDFTADGIQILEQASGAFIAGVGAGDAFPGRFHHYELRQALNAGDQLNALTGTAGWNFSITGYKFQL